MDPIATRSDAGAAQYLSFALGDAQYCIHLLKVQEIRTYERPTRIASAPAFMKGVVNLRGTIVPIIDLRMKLDLEEQRYDAQTVVIILSLERRTVGVVVDAVSDVIGLSAAEIKPAPELVSSAVDARYLEGLASSGGKMIVVMDIERLLAGDDVPNRDEADAQYREGERED